MFILKKKNEVENEVNIAIKLHSPVTNEDESLTELGLNILRNSMPKQTKLESLLYKFNDYIDTCSDLQSLAKYCKQIHEVK